MRKEFDSGEQKKALIQNFERHLKGETNLFLDWEAFEEIIEHYVDKGKYNLALKACALAEEMHPFSMETFVAKARILNYQEQFEEALTILEERVLPLQASDLDALSEKAHSLFGLGDCESSLEILEHVLLMGHEREETLYRIGLAKMALDRVEEAIGCFKQTLESNPYHSNALFELAYCYDVTDKIDESVKYYMRFIDEEPYSQHAWYNLGILFNKQGKREKAIWAYDYATLIDPTFSSAMFNMGKTYAESGKPDKALEIFSEVVKLEGPSSEVYLQMALTYQIKGDDNNTILNFQNAIQENENFAEAWFFLGNYLVEQLKFTDAIPFLKKATQLEPDNDHFWRTLGQARFHCGNITDALEAYEEAVVLNPAEINIWTEWSDMYQWTQQSDKAVEIMTAALEEFPDAAQCHYRLAAYNFLGGKRSQAVENLEKALTNDFEKHKDLIVFFPELEKDDEMMRIIDKYRNK
ncbi:hypothetical protein FUAX_06030 [Fulvitalea axinellae]|uniref:Tetratricopeptide repeat protein n=1 Tax=Fulvitalea axinellae TaxID=1182444 RepID=A0AAU9D5U2_9BACT|nr:hypothetical protein FUAX_06030 [Fulvitalea axinellae]